MSLNSAPESVRTHIGIFGRTNVGKSSLLNALTNQEVSIVSHREGTTTDPVKKAMELLPLGPVLFTDTAGLDDETELGGERVKRAKAVLKTTDIMLLVADASEAPIKCERELLTFARGEGLPMLIALNKSDVGRGAACDWETIGKEYGAKVLYISAVEKTGIDALKDALASLKPEDSGRVLVRDLVPANSVCVLVVPIDSAAPKGRLILPQQQVIRDLLEGGAIPIVTRDVEYSAALKALVRPPALVITDSQVFGFVAECTPRDVPLTSFSMLFARYKGDIRVLSAAAQTVDDLRENDHVLICEGCTHHRQCDDIGSVKIPRWLEAYSGRKLRFSFASGKGFSEDLSGYRLIVHCGGCMLNGREMHARISGAEEACIPMVNYGVLIAHMNGILTRCLEPFRF